MSFLPLPFATCTSINQLHHSLSIKNKQFKTMKAITIEGKNRSDIGKKSTAAIRKDGNIPCSIYGGKANVNFYAAKTSFKDLVYTPEFYTANISVDGKNFSCVI